MDNDFLHQSNNLRDAAIIAMKEGIDLLNKAIYTNNFFERQKLFKMALIKNYQADSLMYEARILSNQYLDLNRVDKSYM